MTPTTERFRYGAICGACLVGVFTMFVIATATADLNPGRGIADAAATVFAFAGGAAFCAAVRR